MLQNIKAEHRAAPARPGSDGPEDTDRAGDGAQDIISTCMR